MGNVLLTAAMIVRNEARHIGPSLASLAGIADDVVVVDTGSNDDTKAIAAAAGARVFDFAWRDDFAAARNHALEQARGRWILYIDADERARCEDVAALHGLLNDSRFIGLHVQFHVHADHTPYPELRLFRNDPSIRFEGAIHETMWPSIRRHLGEGNGQIASSALEISHLGYAGNLAHKVQRNLPLLERAVERDPERVYLWCELGKAYDELDRPGDAARAFERALSIIRAREAIDPTDNVAYVDAVRSCFRNRLPVDSLIAEGLQHFPDNGFLRWNRACRMMQSSDFDAALTALHELGAAHAAGTLDSTIAYDRRIFGLFMFEALGMCCFKLGRFAEAERHLMAAAREDPGSADLARKLEMVRQIAGSNA